MIISKRVPQVLLLSLAGILPFACTVEDPCDPGEVYCNGYCYSPIFVPPMCLESDGTGGGTATGGMGGETATGGMGGGPSTGGMPLGGESGDGDGTGGAEEGTGGTTEPVEEPNFGEPCTEQSQCKGGATCYLDAGGVCGGYCGPGDEFEAGCPGTGTTCSEVFPGVSVCLAPM